MYVNVIKSYRDVVAICDEDLLGKVFEEGKFQLDVKESFYKGAKGKKVSKEELLGIIKNLSMEDATFNIVGAKSVALALEEGIVTPEGIKKIHGIPFTMVLL